MTDMIDTNESGNEILDMPIEKLREYAKLLKVPVNRNWNKDEYIKAIRERVQIMEVAHTLSAEEEANAPAVGYSRIMIHKDPSPNASNRGIELSLNGYIISVPRGVTVDIPTAFEEVLRNSTATTTVNTNNGAKNMTEERYETVTTTAYPYTVIARGKQGVFKNPNDQRRAKHEIKVRFLTKFDKWPTDAELNSAIARGALDNKVE